MCTQGPALRIRVPAAWPAPGGHAALARRQRPPRGGIDRTRPAGLAQRGAVPRRRRLADQQLRQVRSRTPPRARKPGRHPRSRFRIRRATTPSGSAAARSARSHRAPSPMPCRSPRPCCSRTSRSAARVANACSGTQRRCSSTRRSPTRCCACPRATASRPDPGPISSPVVAQPACRWRAAAASLRS
jgi:hypothetical protein